MTTERVAGVLGTFVWDRIWGEGWGSPPRAGWGGLFYSVAAVLVELARDPRPDVEWTVRPLAKVGRDAYPDIAAILQGWGCCTQGLVPVDVPNNMVRLRYHPDGSRTTTKEGPGVPPWTMGEAGGHGASCHNVLANFVTGRELTLEAAQTLSRVVPVYADLHGLDDAPRLGQWLACFEGAQLNEAELARLHTDNPWEVQWSPAKHQACPLMVRTLGPAGCLYSAELARAEAFGGGPDKIQEYVPQVFPANPGWPTGCGDVFAGAMFANLAMGRSPHTAAVRANLVASRNARSVGIGGLPEALRG